MRACRSAGVHGGAKVYGKHGVQVCMGAYIYTAKHPQTNKPTNTHTKLKSTNPQSHKPTNTPTHKHTNTQTQQTISLSEVGGSGGSP